MDTNSIRRENLRALAARYQTQAEFAAACGTAPSVISLIVSPNPKRNLGSQLARKIEQATGMPNGWLDQVHDRQEAIKPRANVDSNASDLFEIETWDDGTPLSGDDVSVPFLKEVELAAGNGRSSVEVDSARRLRFGSISLRKKGVDPANARCVQVAGNSMEPVLKNGDTAAIDVGCTRILDGDMYAISHGGQLRVKQLYRMPGGGLRIRSFNRDEHPDEEYTLDQVEDQEILILGRVFWSGGFH